MYSNKTGHQICFMIFYSINPSIFLQNDKYSNTNHVWQKTAEYLIDILHFNKKLLSSKDQYYYPRVMPQLFEN